jgi:hypothetical protein
LNESKRVGYLPAASEKAASEPKAPLLPNESSHVFEKYWDYLPCLDQHPDFSNESEYTQRHMLLFFMGYPRCCTTTISGDPNR